MLPIALAFIGFLLICLFVIFPPITFCSIKKTEGKTNMGWAVNMIKKAEKVTK
jgi:hypothetical protein